MRACIALHAMCIARCDGIAATLRRHGAMKKK